MKLQIGDLYCVCVCVCVCMCVCLYFCFHKTNCSLFLIISLFSPTYVDVDDVFFRSNKRTSKY